MSCDGYVQCPKGVCCAKLRNIKVSEGVPVRATPSTTCRDGTELRIRHRASDAATVTASSSSSQPRNGSRTTRRICCSATQTMPTCFRVASFCRARHTAITCTTTRARRRSLTTPTPESPRMCASRAGSPKRAQWATRPARTSSCRSERRFASRRGSRS